MDKNKIETLVKEALGDITLEFQRVQKNNSMLDGVVVRRETATCCPVIYINTEDTPEHIADTIIKAYKAAPGLAVDPATLQDKNFIFKNVLPFVVKFADNAYVLDKARTTFLDLAVLYRVYLSPDASFVIPQDMPKKSGFTVEELHAAALENLRQDVKITSMAEMLGMPEMPGMSEMIIITNKRGSYGAAGVLLPEILQQVGERIGSDFYILPSSIHELIAINADNMDYENARGMICTVNAAEVADCDILSDHPYFYKLQAGILTT